MEPTTILYSFNLKIKTEHLQFYIKQYKTALVVHTYYFYCIVKKIVVRRVNT